MTNFEPLNFAIWNFTDMRLKITGHSMEPTLRQGDRVWASFFLRKPRKGDIVILRHPHPLDELGTPHRETLLVKRIAKDLGDERYEVEGDNPNDSLNIGITSRKERNKFVFPLRYKIIAKVHLRYWPKSDRRWF